MRSDWGLSGNPTPSSPLGIALLSETLRLCELVSGVRPSFRRQAHHASRAAFHSGCSRAQVEASLAIRFGRVSPASSLFVGKTPAKSGLGFAWQFSTAASHFSPPAT